MPPAPDARDQDERRNIVVYVERVSAGATGGPRERAALRQRDERFAPHIVPVVRGTTVDFPNDDPLFHNVFSLSRTKEFDLGRYPRGASRSVTFERPGVVQVFCHIHSDMSAIVLVLDNGYFAVPDGDGRYSIPNLPPGEYTLVAWHERIRPIVHPLRLEPGQVARVDFTIPLPAADAARER
jgi:plastocyanin